VPFTARTKEIMATDQVFKALADPTRRMILRLLNGRELTAGQLAEHFDISAPSMSHHFNVLKQADLIAARREGQQIFYSLNTTAFQDLMATLLDLFVGKEDGHRRDGGK
jgi:DNA-binding transcriptional ArsR family regulator